MRYPVIVFIFYFFALIPLFSQDQGDSLLPHVILIVADDMGWNDVSYHGSEIQTPTLDKLASEGVELNRFYVHSACSPTRSALMTGKAAVRLGFVNPISKNNERGLPLAEKIMPQYFKDKGYATYLIGKWHLGRFKKEYWPYNRGFDYFYGNLTGGVGHYDHVHGGSLDWQRNGETVEEEGYTTHLLTDEAIKIIRSRDSRPFFLELSYAAPHMPNEAPEATVAAYQHIENRNRQLHAAMVTEVDRGIQKLIEALEEEDLLDRTIIWFMSDNGGKNLVGTPQSVAAPILDMAEIWGAPLPFPFWEFLRDNMVNGAGDNHPLRGGKATVYEGGLRVPSFIYAPAFISQQKVAHQITVHDVLPTLAEAASIEQLDTTQIDGQSQWRFLLGEAAAASLPYVSVGKWGEAYYKGEWKLILQKEAEPELYRIIEDPTEQLNLASQYPAVVSAMSAELAAFPRGESVDDPLWRVFLDTDKFGGEIDRPPFAGREGRVSGPLHPSFYVAGILAFVLLSLCFQGVRKLIQYVQGHDR
ncbi:MAG: arylsulfatase [Bacteroidota bacterium]